MKLTISGYAESTGYHIFELQIYNIFFTFHTEYVAELPIVGTYGLYVRKAGIDYQRIIRRTDRASLLCWLKFRSFATPSAAAARAKQRERRHAEVATLPVLNQLSIFPGDKNAPVKIQAFNQ
jgi:hypothetical protein